MGMCVPLPELRALFYLFILLSLSLSQFVRAHALVTRRYVGVIRLEGSVGKGHGLWQIDRWPGLGWAESLVYYRATRGLSASESERQRTSQLGSGELIAMLVVSWGAGGSSHVHRGRAVDTSYAHEKRWIEREGEK